MRRDKVLKVHLSDSMDGSLSVPPLLYLFLFLLAIALFVMDTGQMRPAVLLKEAYQDSLDQTLAGVQGKVKGWESLLGDWRNLYEADQVNQKLKVTLVALRDKIQVNEQNIKKLETLKQQVNYLPAPDASFVTVTIRRYNYGPTAKRMLIEYTPHPAIAPRRAVTAHGAMVGRILSTKKRGEAEVLLVTDKASRIPVIGEMSKQTALLQGTDGAALEMRYTHDLPFMNGELLLTTGDDQFLPAGIPVAKIVMKGSSVYALPLYQPKDIDFAQVIY